MKANTKLFAALLLTTLIFQASTIVPCTPTNTNHISGTSGSDPHICVCQSPYIWKPSIYACVRDCGQIANAVPNCLQSDSNIEACDCQTGYNWDKDNKICGKICTGIVNTQGVYDPAHTDQCLCTDTSYQWNEKYQQCVRICTPSSTTHVAGLDLTAPYTKCTCQDTYMYDQTNNVCVQKCITDPNAHLKTGTTNQCQCNTGYQLHLYSGDSVQKCGKICSANSAISGKDENNPNDCICNTGYVWPDATKYPTQAPYQQCILNCRADTTLKNTPNTNKAVDICNCDTGFDFKPTTTIIPAYPGTCQRVCTGTTHSNGLVDTSDITKCQCDTGYVWQYQDKYTAQCVRTCDIDSSAPNTDLTKNGGWKSYEECQCQAGYIWDSKQSPPKCVKDCSKTAINQFSTGNIKTGTTDQCQCVDGYKFDTTAGSTFENKCILDCSKLNVYTLTNTDVSVCKCSDGFSFINSTVGCGRDCGAAVLTNSLVQDSKNILICTCDVGYHWSQQTNAQYQCAIDCTGDFTAKTHVSRTQCDCTDKTQYQWVTPDNTCKRKCTGVPNSQNKVDPSNNDHCLCIDGYRWNAPDTTPYDNRYDYQCIKDCSQKLDINTDGTNKDTVTCNCDTNFVWQIDPKSGYENKCVRNCNSVANSNRDYVHTSADTVGTCDCLLGYLWNADKLTCDNPCGTNAAPNSIATTCYNPLQCSCKDGFTWDKIKAVCASNCDVTANQYWNTNTKKCQTCAKNTYQVKWDVANNVCRINCSLYTGAAEIAGDFVNCDCGAGITWDATNFLCPSPSARLLLEDKNLRML